MDYVAKCASCGPDGGIVKVKKDDEITYHCAIGKDTCTVAMTFSKLYENEDMPVIEQKSYKAVSKLEKSREEIKT